MAVRLICYTYIYVLTCKACGKIWGKKVAGEVHEDHTDAVIFHSTNYYLQSGSIHQWVYCFTCLAPPSITIPWKASTQLPLPYQAPVQNDQLASAVSQYFWASLGSLHLGISTKTIL